MPDDELPPAMPAATVVLLRDTPDGVETLMLRRDSKLAFAGGAWVFPGGRIDPEDYPGGDFADDPDAVFAGGSRRGRREAMEEAGLAVDPAGLVWFAHWTPPAAAPPALRDLVLLARAPEGAVTVDDGEIHDHQWIRPADALRRRDAGEIHIIPPTWMTLRRSPSEPIGRRHLAAARAREPTSTSPTSCGSTAGSRRSGRATPAYEDGDRASRDPGNRLLMSDDGWRVETS